jgi:hypothetical protein
MNRWNAFHKAEENNNSRIVIKGLEDDQAADQALDTQYKSQKAELE